MKQIKNFADTILTVLKNKLLFYSLFLISTMQLICGQIAITDTGIINTYTQNFDALAVSGYSSTLPVGWAILETGTNANDTYNANKGSSTTGNSYSYGSTGESERALGCLRSGTLEPIIGVAYINNTGRSISELTISYTGEQWRLGTLGRLDKLDFQYSLNATSLNNGQWTDVNELDFVAPITMGVVGALNGNTTSNRIVVSYTINGLSIPNGATFRLRFNDYLAVGSDDGLAIDDFSLYATVATIWNGTWTNGTPTATVNAVINAAYSTFASGAITALNLIITANNTLTINTGTNVTVAAALTNNGNITIQNNANLVQTSLTNTNSGSGTVSVSRNGSSLFRQDYTLWSSPVTGMQTLLNFSPETVSTRFYQYNESTDLFNAISTSSTFIPGSSYLIRMPNTDLAAGYDAGTAALAFPGIFPGAVNNGNISVSLTKGLNGFTAVGNPYPSVIDAELFLTANAAIIENTLYFWRKTNAAAGSAYATYTAAGATSVTPTSALPNGKIQIGQGFLVQAKSTRVVPAFFTNAMRDVIPSSTQFFKTKQQVQKNRIWLNLKDSNGLFSQTLIAYIDDASIGIDRYDGKYINDSPTALTTSIDNEEYSIQGRPSFDESDVVALHFKTSRAGNYTIALDHVDGLFSTGHALYLEDKNTGLITNLTTKSYIFAANSGIDKARFHLKYQMNLKGSTAKFDENSVIISKNRGGLLINSNGNSIISVSIYDIHGRVITERKNVNSQFVVISNLKAINQVLIVKVTAADNTIVNKKIIN